MGKKTPFYQCHVEANAKIVDFAGWDMPLHYGSQIQEHHQVRRDAGMFDVSHMGIVDVQGEQASDYLRYILANDVGPMMNGKAIYTCMLNEKGGVLDDLIVYKLAHNTYRLVVNAGRREKDYAWLQKQALLFKQVNIIERNELAMLAVQGPQAEEKIIPFFSKQKELLKALKPFTFLNSQEWFISRTGYTGEKGYEIIFPAFFAARLWQSLLDLNIKPCGLGARDTLRLEAGLNLYGADMDETVTPLESNLAWTVVMQPYERNFIGRKALEEQIKQGVKQHLVGLVLEGPGVMRPHQTVLIEGDGIGEVTSGTYSPTLEKSIGLARLPVNPTPICHVNIRDKQVPAKIIKPPFVRREKTILGVT